MANIKITGTNENLEVTDGANLRDELIKAGHAIKSTCGGCASCAQCVVIIEEGEGNVSEISFEEKQLLGNVFHITKERLSCQTKVNGDISVNIDQHKSLSKSTQKTIRKSKTQLEEEKNQPREERPVREGGFKKPKSFKFDNEN